MSLNIPTEECLTEYNPTQEGSMCHLTTNVCLLNTLENPTYIWKIGVHTRLYDIFPFLAQNINSQLFIKVVLMSITIYVWSKNKENIITYHSINAIFRAMIYHIILHSKLM